MRLPIILLLCAALPAFAQKQQYLTEMSLGNVEPFSKTVSAENRTTSMQTQAIFLSAISRRVESSYIPRRVRVYVRTEFDSPDISDALIKVTVEGPDNIENQKYAWVVIDKYFAELENVRTGSPDPKVFGLQYKIADATDPKTKQSLEQELRLLLRAKSFLKVVATFTFQILRED